MLLYAILVVGVLVVVSESFKFEEVSRLAQVGIPLYSLVMAVITIVRDHTHLWFIVPALAVGALLGWLQTTHVQVKRTDEKDRFGRPVVKVRKGWTYALGWALVFVSGICFHILLQGTLPWDDVWKDLAKDVARDITSVFFFTSGVSWYTWAISGSAAYMYGFILRAKDPDVAEALHDEDMGFGLHVKPLGQKIIDEIWRRKKSKTDDTDN
jgi:hypothetical protein